MFKWKTVKNDMSTGTRSEVLEVMNKDEEDQMRKSVAKLFRKDMEREDILKEPMTIYFNSMMTFSDQKNKNKQKLVESQRASQVAS